MEQTWVPGTGEIFYTQKSKKKKKTNYCFTDCEKPISMKKYTTAVVAYMRNEFFQQQPSITSTTYPEFPVWVFGTPFLWVWGRLRTDPLLPNTGVVTGD